ncbi:hypothetical protein ACQP2C_32125 [Micromonospora zamorensis]|uniref:hypothetical protein n=1 Tax=Micromonospora zamorensis TaxID=709883 RepID=UPI003D972253
MELTKQFSEQQYARALESWAWLDLAGKAPRFTSLFGDVFLESADGCGGSSTPSKGSSYGGGTQVPI